MRLIFLILVQLTFSFSLFSQNHITLKGKVTDSMNRQPLAFAYVKLSDLALGTVTNGEGEFVLNIPVKYSDKNVEFSYLGYVRKTYSIRALQEMNPLAIELKRDVTQIKEVVIKPEKSISAKKLLAMVIKNIEQNYAQEPVYLDGYYRETVAENGAFISYADAAVKVHYAPYQENSYKWNEYWTEAQGAVYTLSTSNVSHGKTLHRGHFHSQTIMQDQAKVIDSRSSANLTKTDMYAHVEGGPMGIFSKDYLKYKAAFFSDKKFRKFDFDIGEVLTKNGYVYVLTFRTVLTKELMEELAAKNKTKAFNKASRNKVLEGKIYVDKQSYAVLKFECSVPAEFKDYFCSYTTMDYKHFDYKLNVEYQKIGSKYYLKYLWHEDEFILNDTITNNITPYYAVSQFWIDSVTTQDVEKLNPTEVFANMPSNQLFDLALEYHSEFWQEYTMNNPRAIIPDSIRNDMEGKESLETQFAVKHHRNESLPPPVAMQIPVKITLNDTTLIDNYAWLKQPKNTLRNIDIKEYLMAENAYTDNYFVPLRKNQRDLFMELTGRIEKEDESIPVEQDGYWYQRKWTEEQEYPIYLRRKDGAENWDTLLNVNVLAKDYDYYSAGGIGVSPNTNLMLYYENTTGSDKSIIKFKNLETGLVLKDSLSDVSGIHWLSDHELLYTLQEPKTNRTYQLKLHKLNTAQQSDSLLYQEDDARFQIGIGKSKSKDYMYLSAASSNTNEVYFMNLNAIEKGFHLMAPREENHIYSVTDYKNEFYIISNAESPNFEVFKCSETKASKADWESFLKPQKDNLLVSFDMFDDFMVTAESKNMETQLNIIDKNTGKSHRIKIKEDIPVLATGHNPKFDTDTLQYTLTTLKSPPEVWNYNMRTKEERLVKKQLVKNYYKRNWVKHERVWAQARDGTMIPITLLYRKWDKKKENYKRLFMTSYGSYGMDNESSFNAAIYSLLQRGFIYAIPHVRGGGEMGQQWHDGGKMMTKQNTFTDFIDCAEFLITEGYVEKGNIVAQGGSAGGLLMGGVVNMRPDLFKLVILDVPFVDVINTMLDDQLPLTTIEYEEWGNPNEKEAFDYILKYSPYENVKAQDYPHMLFTTGVNDTRVGYWEPAKMVAKLRNVKTDNNLILLKTNLYAGHGGGSGRFDGYAELAWQYAVIFDIFSKDILQEVAEKDAAEKEAAAKE